MRIRVPGPRRGPLAAFAAALFLLAPENPPGARPTASPAEVDRAGSPYGSWELEITRVSDTSVETVLTIEPDRLRLTRRCYRDRFMVQVEAVSPVRITFDEMRILDSDLAEQSHGPADLECRVSLTTSTLEYTVRDAELRLFDPLRHETQVFTRREL